MPNIPFRQPVPYANLAKEFILLVREDVRTLARGANAFQDWWLLKGHREYAAWADQMMADRMASLFEVGATVPVGGLDFPIPRVVSLLAKQRRDVVKALTRDGKLDQGLFVAWCIVRGLAEQRLAEGAPATLVASLDRPLPSTLSKDMNAGELPATTLLMYLVWILCDKQVRAQRDIRTAEGREQFFTWFFTSAQGMGITPLISARWRAWLRMMVIAAPNGQQVPRFAKMAWIASPELQKKVPLDAPDDLRNLDLWAEKAVVPSGPWAWLRASRKPDGKAPVAGHNGIDKKRAFGINIYGFAYGELGIGEDLRMAVQSCKEAGIPWRIVNINAGGNVRQADFHVDGEKSQDRDEPYAINLFCLPAFDMVNRIYLAMGADHFAGFYNIGWWPWELPVFPKAWSPVFELIDEVWAGSRFLHEMYSKATTKPVTLMPLSASVERVGDFDRRHFALPQDEFLFLFIFDFNSSLVRKNPMAVIEAFQQAFDKKNSDVGLVLKTMNGRDEDNAWQAFLKRCEADKRIHLITGTLDRPEVLGLIKVCDAYVSLHRAEGFGRTLAEAMLLGKPVVATNYSGNVDFMHSDFSFPVDQEPVAVNDGDYHWIQPSDNAAWADPDVAHASQQMQRVFQIGVDEPRAAAVRKFALDQFSSKRAGQLINQRLEQIRAYGNAGD
jgi:glycosyltransferase involved in cell wall biosynthesis